MKVSAIMPTYNQAEFLVEALESVKHQVDELIIIDDGSTDATKIMLPGLLSPKISAEIYKDNRGTAEAINSGFSMTTGDLVTWVSSDNIHAPDWRAKLEAAFADDVAVVYSAFRHGFGGPILFKQYDPKRLVQNEACYIGPSFLMRRWIWEEAGAHRGRISHDYDHWLRVEEVCWKHEMRIVGIPECLCDYRIHPAAATRARGDEYDADHWQQVARERRS